MLWVAGIALLITLLIVLVPYRTYANVLKWLCLSLAAYAIVALMPQVHKDWGAALHGFFIPAWQGGNVYLLTVVGFLGTTISPYLFFWQASEEVEEEILAGKQRLPGHRFAPCTDQEVTELRTDTFIGMGYSQLITFFIVISAAATLHATGKTDINTAQEAAQALLPLGAAAYWLFALGIVGTGLLAIPTLAGSVAYAVAETRSWRYGLYLPFTKAKAFYLTLVATIGLGAILNAVGVLSPVKALLYSAVANGLIAPFLIGLLLYLCNKESVMKNRRNSLLSNILGIAALLLMGAAAILLIWSLVTGQT